MSQKKKAFISRYYFTEGNPLLDVVEYKLNFELVSRIPTSIVLQPILFCPGFSTTVEAEIIGSYSLNPNSIKWLFANDNVTWYDVNTQKENFALSMDGLMLEISKITKEVFIKVKASSSSGETESVQKVTFLGKSKVFFFCLFFIYKKKKKKKKKMHLGVSLPSGFLLFLSYFILLTISNQKLFL